MDPEHKILKSGNLEAVFENCSLRYITAGNAEVLRMVYPSVRTEGWLTIEPEILKTEFFDYHGGFKAIINCKYQNETVHFEAVYTITGSSDNTILFEMEGTAITSFKKNRIGFCILHPVENIRGRNCFITHSNGISEETTFPYHISPHQPFKDIKEMRWNITDAFSAILSFSGDIFETEDQRNWTDNSYKTYCTPLEKPYPVQVAKGEKIFQKVKIKVKVEEKLNIKNEDNTIIRIFPDEIFKLPGLGVGRSSRQGPALDKEMDLIKTLPFDHYRVELFLFDANWKTVANNAWHESNTLGFALELAIFFGKEPTRQLKEFIAWVNATKPQISLIHVFDRNASTTPNSLIETIIPELKREFPEIQTGGGTNANFAQLNRAELNTNNLDFLSFSIHPQEHVYDNLSLVENIEAQKYTIETLRHRYGNIEVIVSPVTLKRRLNANIENYENKSEGNTFPSQIDPRQVSIFAALWTLGSLKYLSESGTTRVTYFETLGERGLFQGSLPTQWPTEFLSFPGMIFPVYHLFKFLLQHKDAQVIKSESSTPLSVEVLALKIDHNPVFILANYQNRINKVRFKDLKSAATLTYFDASHYKSSIHNSDWNFNSSGKNVMLDSAISLTPCSLNLISVFNIC